jgi:short-subunit dehydrogenase
MTALVTGATSGIGAAFVARLAADGNDVVLVARGERALEEKAETTRRTYGVAAETLVADLSTRDGQDAVARRLDGPSGPPVDFLVNCAGSATASDFADTDGGALRALLELNVASVQALTRAALPGMLRRGRGTVVNVSSMNAYLTLPGGAATYGAGKAFVAQLTKGIALSLPTDGVRVMALCPGPTRTSFHESSGTGRGTAPVWLARSPEWVVERALDDLRRGRIVSMPGVGVRAAAAVGHLVPASAMAHAVRYVRARRSRGRG